MNRWDVLRGVVRCLVWTIVYISLHIQPVPPGAFGLGTI